jgi:hypothetical protein
MEYLVTIEKVGHRPTLLSPRSDRPNDPRGRQGSMRYQGFVRRQPGTPPLLAGHHENSVTKAKRALEAIIGPVQWRDNQDPGAIRATATIGHIPEQAK